MTTNNTPDRTAHDYAIEHAEYMACAAERLDAALNSLHRAEERLLDLTEAVATNKQYEEYEALVEQERESVGELRIAVRNHIHEFRKRRDRALAEPAMPADEWLKEHEALMHRVSKAQIELPPLAKPQVPRIDADIDLMDIRRLAQWCERTAKDYARQAIAHARPFIIEQFLNESGQYVTNAASRQAAIDEAIAQDRQQRGEPVAWHSKLYGTVWMAIKPGSLPIGQKWFIDGRTEPVAEVVSPVSLQWHIATSDLPHGTVFYTAPHSAEPVKGPSDADLLAFYEARAGFEIRHPTRTIVPMLRELLTRYSNAAQPAASVDPVAYASTNQFKYVLSAKEYTKEEAARAGYSIPVFDAPQPTEPVKGPSDAATALQFAANVVELYDDATMRDDDYMIDAGECAGILNALAGYFARYGNAAQPEGTRPPEIQAAWHAGWDAAQEAWKTKSLPVTPQEDEAWEELEKRQ